MEKYYFKVTDYLHIACTGKHSVKLILRKEGSYIGEIVILNGVLWNAVDKSGNGEEAFLRLIFKKNIEVESFDADDNSVERLIEKNWEEILMKAVADRDKNKWENKKNIENGSTKNMNISVIIEQGLDCLMRRDYKNAIKIFSDLNEMYPGNILIRSKLDKLKELGFRDNSASE